MYIYIYIFIYVFLHILFMCASKVRTACIIVPYKDGSKAPIRLSWRGRSCLAFVRSGIFEKVPCGSGYTGLRERIQF